jgi:hypothetical protein
MMSVSALAIYHHLKSRTRCAFEGLFGNCCLHEEMLKRFHLLFRERLNHCQFGIVR